MFVNTCKFASISILLSHANKGCIVMNTGERIKQLRKEKGLSAEYIAEMIGVSPSTIYRYENNDIASMKIDKLKMIADLLGTSASDLLGWSDDPSALSDAESFLLSSFRKMNEKDQGRVLGFVESILSESDYIKTVVPDSVTESA